MRKLLFFSALLMAGITGCDQRQGQMLDLFQKQIQEKDKTIEELNQKINELDRRNAELEGQIEKAGDPDKIAEAIGKRIDGRLADLRNHVDQLAQAGGGGGGAPRTASGGGAVNPLPRPSEDPGPSPRLTNPPPSDKTPTDPNRKKMKFDFN